MVSKMDLFIARHRRLMMDLSNLTASSRESGDSHD
jgi:hypothetical protein